MAKALNPQETIYDHDSFEISTEKAIDWLRYNANPHAVIIVSSTGAVLYTGELSIAFGSAD